MKSKISSRVFMVLFTGATIISSAQMAIESTSTDKNGDISLSDKTEAKVSIEDYFPGPNFMKLVASKNNGLRLSEDQQKTFAQWGKKTQPKLKAKLQKISKLEMEMESISREGADAKKILEKQEKAENLREEIAITKFKCHELMVETLSPEQWKTLVTNYEKKFPFVERTRMFEVMQHVNPLPNYMQVIQKDSEGLGLSSEQTSKFDIWSREHHPKMMEMANRIITSEKEIYQESLQKKSDADLLEKIKETSKLRTAIVETKTSCRNVLIETLNNDQWAALVEKTK